MKKFNYENFLNLESLIKDSQKNTEMLLEIYFRLTSSPNFYDECDDEDNPTLSHEEILNALRTVKSTLTKMEKSINEKLDNLN